MTKCEAILVKQQNFVARRGRTVDYQVRSFLCAIRKENRKVRNFRYEVYDINGFFFTNSLFQACSHARSNCAMRTSWELNGWWEDSMAQVKDPITGIVLKEYN